MSQKCFVIGLSIASGMKEITLRVQDQTQFEVGKEYEIVPRELEPVQAAPADNVVTLAPDTTTAKPPEASPIKPCTICNGSGVVALSQGQNTTPERCANCSGTGIEPAKQS